MARFVALAILLAIAAGIYGFIQSSKVTAAEMQIANTEKELATWKTRATQYQTENKASGAAAETCKAQLTEAQTALETANAALTKKPGAKR